MSESTAEFVLPNQENPSVVDKAEASATKVVSNRFKPLGEKARHIARLTTNKTALTVGTLALIALGVGHIEDVRSFPEPIDPSVYQEYGESIRKMPQEQVILPDGSRFFDEIKVTFDENEKSYFIPTGYFLPDGKRITFDKEWVEQLRKKAISSGEPQVIVAFPAEVRGDIKDTWKNYAAPEHPQTKDLPEDILSEKQLKEKGVTIIQPPRNQTKLHIRKGAFEDGPLADLNNQKRKLNIVLIDGPFIAHRFLQEERYDKFRHFIPPENINNLVKIEKASLRDSIDYYRKQLNKFRLSPGNGAKASFAELDLVDAKSKLMIFESGKLTNEQIAKLVPPRNAPVGQYFEPYSKGPVNVPIITGSVLSELEKDNSKDNNDKIVPTDEANVFLCVGEPDTLQQVTLFFTSDGNYEMRVEPFYPLPYSRPTPSQTHPNPETFRINPNASKENSYLYSSNISTGFALRHELAHDKLINQQWNRSEYDTDIAAMETIRKAWEKWVKSGYGDNSGYYFVFSLPSKWGGGYILTRHNKPPNNFNQSNQLSSVTKRSDQEERIKYQRYKKMSLG